MARFGFRVTLSCLYQPAISHAAIFGKLLKIIKIELTQTTEHT
jgi:hypothetical protein